MPKPRELTESERTTVTNGLRVAAERFQEHVKQLSQLSVSYPAEQFLLEQFGRQHKESLDLAALIDNCESISVTEGVA